MAYSKSQKETAVGDRTEEVDGYNRTLSNGTVVTVEDHSRTNDAATAAVIATPGRPPIAAKPGTFPNGRFLPYLWLKPTETTEIDEAYLDDAKVKNKGAITDESTLNKSEVKAKKPDRSKKAEKVVNALAELVKEKSQKKVSGGQK